tara:strand:+ start:605 stop:1444 length:840 start_codon:yes stop_codon:yes gene_type:complete
MWFAVLKDSDFQFDTEYPTQGGHFNPKTKETIINLAFRDFKHMDEDEIINQIIEFAGHESGHKAFESVTSDYATDSMKKVGELFNNAFTFFMQETMTVALNTNVQFRPDITDNQLTEMKAEVETVIERKLLDEVFAGISGGNESISRVLMERYHLEMADRIRNGLNGQLRVLVEVWSKRFNSPEYGNLIDYLMPQVEEMMNMFINTIYDIALAKGTIGLLNAIVKQIKRKQYTNMDKYEKIIKVLVDIERTDILLDYIKTGDMNVIDSFIEEENAKRQR